MKRSLWLLALLACQPAAAPSTETITLTPGTTHSRTLLQGRPHRFRFDLAAGRFLHLIVEQSGVDIVVRLLDPAGRVLLDIDNPDGRRRPEAVLAETPVAGTYVLEVAPFTAGSQGNFALLVRAVRPARPDDRRRAATAAALNRAERRWQSGDFESAAASLRQLLPSLESRAEPRDAAQARWRLGSALRRTGELRESATVLEEAAARYRRLEDGLGEARVLNELGAVRRFLSDPAGALAAYQRALDLYRRAGMRSGEASAINNIGLVRESTGDFQGAITQYEEALRLWRHLGATADEATTLQNLGSLYVLIGHDDEGLDLLRRALALSRGATDERVRMSTLIALGWAELLTGRAGQALERFDEAIAIARRTGDRLAEAGPWDRRGSALKALGRLDEAAASYARSLEISRAAGSTRNEGPTLSNLGWLHLETGDLDRARRELRQALGLFEAAGDLNGEASVRIGLSRLERRLGAYGAARQQIDLALQRLEELRAGLRGPTSRGQFLAVRYDAWEELVSLLLELGQPEQALEAAERARARNLLDLLAEGGPHPRPLSRKQERGEGYLTHTPLPLAGEGPGVRASPSEELRRKRALQAEIETIDERRRTLAARDARDPQLPGLAAALRERSLELDRLTIPPPRTGPASLTSRQIQELADPETLLVVYLLSEPASFAWTIDRERIEPHTLPGRQTIETLARRAAVGLPRSHEQAVRGAAERALRDLSEAILAPLSERLADRRRLVILPDGALHLVAFGALPAPPFPGDGSADGRRGRGMRVPLLIRHEIVLIPSTTVLVRQRQRLAGRPPAPAELAVLADPVFSSLDPRVTRGRESAGTAEDRGDPALGFGPLARLPFTADEARAIARLVPEEKRLVVLGAAASRDLAMSGALRRYRILHFATHGLLHPVLPERSGLVLSLFDENGRPRDGFLAAPDVAILDLPADLIVLSACQTGLGREMRGEGLVGLTQAFFRAGARAVIVSSWNVRDRATADLMARVYANLLTRRLPPAAALREAQLSLRRDARTAAPSFWAGFTLHGDWR